MLSAKLQQNPLLRPACLQKFRRQQNKGPQYVWQVIEADISVRGAAKGHNWGSAELFYLDLNSNQDAYCDFFWIIIYQSDISILTQMGRAQASISSFLERVLTL